MERAPTLPRLGEWLPDYPEDDGQPIAVNEFHFGWLVRVRDAIAFSVGERGHVAAHLFWYPVEHDRTETATPDILVAFGRPKDPPRYSYYQWVENNIPPQVVMEILSPSNTGPELAKKRLFYAKYGVEDYYEINLRRPRVTHWQREGDRLVERGSALNQLIPRLGIRFERAIGGLALFDATGTQITDYELERRGREAAEEQLEEVEERLGEVEESTARAEAERDAERQARADAERARDALAAEIARLRALMEGRGEP